MCRQGRNRTPEARRSPYPASSAREPSPAVPRSWCGAFARCGPVRCRCRRYRTSRAQLFARLAALACQRRLQAEARLQAGPAWTDHGLVFTDEFSEPLTGSRITERRLRPLMRRAGLPDTGRKDSYEGSWARAGGGDELSPH